MAYASGTVTSNATPATALISALEAQLSIHAAWAFVEEYVVATKTYRIWKNLGTANGFGSDWYLILTRLTAGTGNVDVQTCEVYDTATHTTLRPAPYEVFASPQTLMTPAADFSYGTAPNPLTGVSGSAAGNDKLYPVTLGTSSTAYDYWFVLSSSNLTVVTRVTATVTTCHVGLFDTLVTSTPVDPFPLVITKMEGTESNVTSVGAFTRMPRQQLSTVQYQFSMKDHTQQSYAWWTNQASVSQVGGAVAVATDILQNNRPVASRAITAHRLGATQPADVGFARGLLRHIALINVTGVAAGDTITIGADTWVYMGIRTHWMNSSAT